MTAATVAPALHPWLELQLAAPLAGALATEQAEARARLRTLTLPSARDEAWRYTDPRPLLDRAWTPASPLATRPGDVIPEAAARLVFVNGHVLSPVPPRPGPVVLGPLSEPAIAAAAAPFAAPRELLSPLADLATARMADGAFLHVPAGVDAGVIHLQFLSVPGLGPEVASPRLRVVLEPGARVTLIEEYLTRGPGVALTHAVAELTVGASAELRHVRLMLEGTEGVHLGHAAITVAQDAQYHARSISLGGAWSRYEPRVRTLAPGVDISLFGLLMLEGTQVGDTHSLLEHATEHGTSRQLHKCVLDDAAHGVFNGRILVAPGAQGTSSQQASRNLLLSAAARIDTKPQLEIFADDVKCAHGATVGALDEEELFYLRSRGLDEAAARDLLVYAFGAEVIEALPVGSLRDRLRARLGARLALRGGRA